MKKALFIFLAILHLFTVVGISMTSHTCKGKTSYNIGGIDFKKSCKCKHTTKIHKNKCCHNKGILVKADYSKDKTTNSTTYTTEDFGVDVFVHNSFAYVYYIHELEAFVFSNKGSPPKHSPPLFLLNSVFLI